MSIPADERPQLAQVVEAVRRRHQPAAGPRDAGELGERLLEIGNVVQHPVGHGHVERRVIEGQGFHVADTRVDSTLARQLDHPWREVDGDDIHAELDQHPLCELTPAASDLQHAPRSSLADRLERRLARIRAGDALVDRCARHQSVFRRVLLSDTLRVVQPSQGSRIGVPVSRLGGAFPPSQAFTVAPTSPNSPSWMWPAAFLPWTYASRSPYSRE